MAERDDDGAIPDLRSLVVPAAGGLVETGNPWEPYYISDPAGGRVGPVSEFLRDLQAAGWPATTQRSYSLALLRWFRFTWAIDVPWSQATRAEARDFKARVSFEPEAGLFTAVELTRGSGAGDHEAAVAVRLLAGEAAAVTVLGDAAYGTGELRGRLEADGHATVIKPPPLRPAVPGGFTGDDFTIDDQAGTATCPAGHAVALGRPHADGTRQAQFKALCAGCPLRQRCTTSKTGRVLSVHPRHALLAAARRDAADPDWKDEYRRWRPPVERAIAWLVARGSRRVPYRGITSNNIWLHNRAAALNLRRLTNLGLTRTTDGTWALA
jgi:IS5 family transposase